jgi:hypothetical protein
MSCFYGLKLHLIVNYQGEIVATKVTTGNVDDTQPVEEFAQGLTDKLYGIERCSQSVILVKRFTTN